MNSIFSRLGISPYALLIIALNLALGLVLLLHTPAWQEIACMCILGIGVFYIYGLFVEKGRKKLVYFSILTLGAFLAILPLYSSYPANAGIVIFTLGCILGLYLSRVGAFIIGCLAGLCVAEFAGDIQYKQKVAILPVQNVVIKRFITDAQNDAGIITEKDSIYWFQKMENTSYYKIGDTLEVKILNQRLVQIKRK